ncbi:hypothetical protein KKC65_00825 [Patescibacteria group bacterium]|nr:hypothetical protein [Patescibacteria group bacterium]
MKFIDKLRNRPMRDRKIIVWAVTIIIGLILASAWIYTLYINMQNFNSSEIIEDLNIPEFNE